VPYRCVIGRLITSLKHSQWEINRPLTSINFLPFVERGGSVACALLFSGRTVLRYGIFGRNAVCFGKYVSMKCCDVCTKYTVLHPRRLILRSSPCSQQPTCRLQPEPFESSPLYPSNYVCISQVTSCLFFVESCWYLSVPFLWQSLILPVAAYMLQHRYRITLTELSELKFVP
jgi:hypothetical protein